MYNVNSIDVSFHILCQFAQKSVQNTIWQKTENFLFFLNDVKKFKTSIKRRDTVQFWLFFPVQKKINFSRQHFSVKNIKFK